MAHNVPAAGVLKHGFVQAKSGPVQLHIYLALQSAVPDQPDV